MKTQNQKLKSGVLVTTIDELIRIMPEYAGSTILEAEEVLTGVSQCIIRNALKSTTRLFRVQV